VRISVSDDVFSLLQQYQQDEYHYQNRQNGGNAGAHSLFKDITVAAVEMV